MATFVHKEGEEKMAKYINADALADKLETLAYDDWNQGIRLTWADACKDLARIVRDEISADTEPVKHGTWIKMSDAEGIYYICSECGNELTRIDSFDPQFDIFHKLKCIDKAPYCPNCGAKMEEEDV